MSERQPPGWDGYTPKSSRNADAFKKRAREGGNDEDGVWGFSSTGAHRGPSPPPLRRSRINLGTDERQDDEDGSSIDVEVEDDFPLDHGFSKGEKIGKEQTTPGTISLDPTLWEKAAELWLQMDKNEEEEGDHRRRKRRGSIDRSSSPRSLEADVDMTREGEREQNNDGMSFYSPGYRVESQTRVMFIEDSDEERRRRISGASEEESTNNNYRSSGGNNPRNSDICPRLNLRGGEGGGGKERREERKRRTSDMSSLSSGGENKGDDEAFWAHIRARAARQEECTSTVPTHTLSRSKKSLMYHAHTRMTSTEEENALYPTFISLAHVPPCIKSLDVLCKRMHFEWQVRKDSLTWALAVAREGTKNIETPTGATMEEKSRKESEITGALVIRLYTMFERALQKLFFSLGIDFNVGRLLYVTALSLGDDGRDYENGCDSGNGEEGYGPWKKKGREGKKYTKSKSEHHHVTQGPPPLERRQQHQHVDVGERLKKQLTEVGRALKVYFESRNYEEECRCKVVEENQQHQESNDNSKGGKLKMNEDDEHTRHVHGTEHTLDSARITAESINREDRNIVSGPWNDNLTSLWRDICTLWEQVNEWKKKIPMHYILSKYLHLEESEEHMNQGLLDPDQDQQKQRASTDHLCSGGGGQHVPTPIGHNREMSKITFSSTRDDDENEGRDVNMGTKKHGHENRSEENERNEDDRNRGGQTSRLAAAIQSGLNAQYDATAAGDEDTWLHEASAWLSEEKEHGVEKEEKDCGRIKKERDKDAMRDGIRSESPSPERNHSIGSSMPSHLSLVNPQGAQSTGSPLVSPKAEERALGDCSPSLEVEVFGSPRDDVKPMCGVYLLDVDEGVYHHTVREEYTIGRHPNQSQGTLWVIRRKDMVIAVCAHDAAQDALRTEKRRKHDEEDLKETFCHTKKIQAEGRSADYCRSRMDDFNNNKNKKGVEWAAGRWIYQFPMHSKRKDDPTSSDALWKERKATIESSVATVFVFDVSDPYFRMLRSLSPTITPLYNLWSRDRSPKNVPDFFAMFPSEMWEDLGRLLGTGPKPSIADVVNKFDELSNQEDEALRGEEIVELFQSRCGKYTYSLPLLGSVTAIGLETLVKALVAQKLPDACKHVEEHPDLNDATSNAHFVRSLPLRFWKILCTQLMTVFNVEWGIYLTDHTTEDLPEEPENFEDSEPLIVFVLILYSVPEELWNFRINLNRIIEIHCRSAGKYAST